MTIIMVHVLSEHLEKSTHARTHAHAHIIIVTRTCIKNYAYGNIDKIVEGDIDSYLYTNPASSEELRVQPHPHAAQIRC
jgi:hypothetical protein